MISNSKIDKSVSRNTEKHYNKVELIEDSGNINFNYKIILFN